MTTTARPLVGRDREVEQLDRQLAEACAGTFRFVSVEGEPGIGKSSLAAELARRADERGCLVFEGRATELERELPYAVLVDALDPYLASLDERTYERLAADGLEELASVFPALRSLGGRSTEAVTAAERFRAHRAVRELIERLAGRRPVLLALDDLHWTDGASLELVRHLIRRPPDAAVMVLVTFRPASSAGPVISAAMEGAAREGQVVPIRLGPLEASAAKTLVQGAADRDRLLRESGGNPFYLLQLARSGATGRSWASSATGDDGVPGAVKASISEELAALPAPVRAFAQAASVTGDPFDLDVATATAAIAERVALGALDELIASDVVRPGMVPRTFHFRHPLVRSAIYASAAPGVLLAAHERAEATLAARGAPATARAHHIAQSARHGDVAALSVLREASRETAQRAPSSAARWFEAALRILPATAAPGERSELLLALASAQAATGRLEDSRAALLRSIELAAGDGPVSRVSLIAACAGVEELLGRHDEAHARLVAALEELAEDDLAQRAALLVNLAVDAFYRMEYELMRERAAQALAIARSLGERPLLAVTTAMTAFGGSLIGTIDDAHARLTEAIELVDALSDEELATRLDAVAWLAASTHYLDRFAEGRARAARGLALARATGQGDVIPVLVQALGNLLFVSGRLVEAAELLDGAVEAARLADNGIALAWSLLNRGYVALLAGDGELCRLLGEEAVGYTSELHSSVVAVWSRVLHGYGLLETGRLERAREALLAAVGGEEAPLVPGAWRANWFEAMTRCELALGRPEEAAAAARRADARAQAFGLPGARALADRALAAVALQAGDAAGAAQLALASATAAEAGGGPVEAALSRMLAARALEQAGDAGGAVGELERAAATFESCGAPGRRDAAERELRRLGHAVPRRVSRGRPAADGVAGLTARELEIARLVVDRRTNVQIAGELFLSVKTIETHMRNIFRKLGASSRVEVARMVARADD